jgi:hypothetical protein
MDGKTLKGARSWDEAGVMRHEVVVEAVEHGTRQVHGVARIVGGDENAAVKDLVDRIAARRGGSLAGVVIHWQRDVVFGEDRPTARTGARKPERALLALAS